MAHDAAQASEVVDLLDTTLSASEVEPFLTAAQRLVADHLEGEGVADATLTEIERYLSAHFATLRDREAAPARESLDDYSVTYQGETGMHLEATHHGQTALLLDPTGKLQALTERTQGASWKTGTY